MKSYQNKMSKISVIERDKTTVRQMVELYAKHHPEFDESIADYACRRLEHCRYGENKPACKDCPIHCYAPDKREEMKKVMRWSGPRMFFYSPRAAFRHIWQGIKNKHH